MTDGGRRVRATMEEEDKLTHHGGSAAIGPSDASDDRQASEPTKHRQGWIYGCSMVQGARVGLYNTSQLIIPIFLAWLAEEVNEMFSSVCSMFSEECDQFSQLSEACTNSSIVGWYHNFHMCFGPLGCLRNSWFS